MPDLLLADEGSASEAARNVSLDDRWTETTVLAREWRVAPQLGARVRRLGWQLPGDDSFSLRRAVVDSFVRSGFRTAKAIQAVQDLSDAGIRVAFIKGVAAMALLYGAPAERAVNDADLLITREDLQRVITLLERRGFRRRGEENLDEYLRFVANSPGFTANRAMALYGPGDSEIDLHWHVGGTGRTTAEILSRVRIARLMEAEIPVVHPADGWLLTMQHTIRENLSVQTVLRDLLDTALWCQYLRDQGELGSAVEGIAETGSLPTALAVTRILRHYNKDGEAARVAAILGKRAGVNDSRSADRLVELFHYQLRNGRIGKDVAYLVHTRPWRQIIAGLGRDWAGFRRAQRSIEDTLGEVQPWHQRVSRLVRTVPGLRGLRLARELVCVKYSMHQE